MDTPEISVVIPAYNAENYIAESIISVINQTFLSWELIIVDDGSTDNTAAVVEKFCDNNKIILVKQPNKGVSAARNTGIKNATGRFITFLDADDHYIPENLKTKYEAIMADSGIEYVYSDLQICDSGMKEMFVEKGIPAGEVRNAVLGWQSKNIPGLSSNIMVQASAIKNKNIYFDTNLSNCADRYFKILLTSRCRGAYIPVALAKYRNTPGSMSKKVFLLEHDELYILGKIKEINIIPRSRERRKIFAKVYLMLSGSWYKDAGKTGRAIKFALKAFLIYPRLFFEILSKGLGALFPEKKGK